MRAEARPAADTCGQGSRWPEEKSASELPLLGNAASSMTKRGALSKSNTVLEKKHSTYTNFSQSVQYDKLLCINHGLSCLIENGSEAKAIKLIKLY